MFKDPRLKKGIIYLSIAILLILFLPYLLTRPNFLGFDFSTTGQIGDTIGGLMGPFVAIVAAILTFMAFWVQYQANEQIRKDIRIDRFETRIYELINLHKQNVNELKLYDDTIHRSVINGREIFKYLFIEFKDCYQKISYAASNKPNIHLPKDPDSLTIISYIIYFVGIRYSTVNFLIKSLENYLQLEDLTELVNYLVSELEQDKIDLMANPPEESPNEFYFDFLKGHTSELGHYYRNLYQTVSYIDSYQSNIISDAEKYKYVKTLRAQLSNHEQLMLYYNSLSPFGRPWLENGYFVKYKMIKNIPLPLADFGITPTEKFAKEIAEAKAKGEDFFEWKE
ncbi:MAG: hypothetical protein B6D44_10200 [Ignavibacteriales bacterium UTCHB2]|jgi:hypothetical protein|nr:MAG: hypothetical protein B6D44_10200 [Ignavibacteriales bacterium UTCHB2]